MINTCTVQRYTEGGVDDYGIPTPIWDLAYLENEPCRLTSGSGREIKVGAEVVIADYKLFLGDVNITEQDRVVIGAITYEILLVQNYADHIDDHHKQCWMRVVR